MRPLFILSLSACLMLCLITAVPDNFKTNFGNKNNREITFFASVPNSHKKEKPGYSNIQNKLLPRIAIAGLAIESSTFSPALTNEEAFYAKYGVDVFSSYPFLSVDSPLRGRAEWLPTLVGRSLPGGAVTREAYESLVNKTLDSLKKNGPYDGLFFDIHGAMSVVGLDDPEGDLITRIRTVIGHKTLVSTSMDLHGNVSWRLAKNTDLITCYRMAPHEDAMDTKQRAVRNLIERIDSGDNPTAGGAGDVTWTLKEILARPEFKKESGPSVIYASIPGPELVKNAITAGIGNRWKVMPARP